MMFRQAIIRLFLNMYIFLSFLPFDAVQDEVRRNLFNSISTSLNPYIILHSVLKLFTGFAIADLTACIPKVIDVITKAMSPASANIHH